MQIVRISMCLTGLVLVLWRGPGAAPPSTMVRGHTYALDAEGRYKPIGGVIIWPSMEAPLRKQGETISTTSDPATGSFKLEVPGERPYCLFFNRATLIPEVVQFAGAGTEARGDNFLKVVLMTPEQH